MSEQKEMTFIYDWILNLLCSTLMPFSLSLLDIACRTETFKISKESSSIDFSYIVQCLKSIVLNIELIRMNILMLDTRNVEQTKNVCMYTWRIYSSRYLDTLLYKVELELNKHWKNAGLYTLATKDWEMWELLLGANWQVRVNRITIAWETVTWEN